MSLLVADDPEQCWLCIDLGRVEGKENAKTKLLSLLSVFLRNSHFVALSWMHVEAGVMRNSDTMKIILGVCFS